MLKKCFGTLLNHGLYLFQTLQNLLGPVTPDGFLGYHLASNFFDLIAAEDGVHLAFQTGLHITQRENRRIVRGSEGADTQKKNEGESIQPKPRRGTHGLTIIPAGIAGGKF